MATIDRPGKLEPEVVEIEIHEKILINLIYLPWQYRKLSDIVSLCESNPQVKMTLAFPDAYAYFDSPESEEYKKLLRLIDQGQIEIAMRLAREPILPLIADTDDAQDLLGENGSLPVPSYSWDTDIRQQIANERERFFAQWGTYPAGFIPAAGFVSPRVIKAMKGLDIAWIVSGPAEGMLYARISADYPKLFFMNDELVNTLYRSDSLLGARYISEKLLENMAGKEKKVVTIVLDEDHYREVFNKQLLSVVNILAEKLTRNTTDYQSMLPREIIASSNADISVISLKQVPISSWQRPDVSWWIGEENENTAWGLLGGVRQVVEKYQNSGNANITRLNSALEEIYEAESGKYYYSFGVDIDSVKDAEIERAFLASLINIYRMIDLEPPEELYHPLEEISGYSSVVQGADDTILELGPGHVRWLDKQGDDHGSGDIEYPLPEEEYPDGSYDLLFFGVKYTNEHVIFEVSFDSMEQSLNSPLGIDLPLIDIYLDLNNRPGAGATHALPGRDFFIASNDAWEYCIMINGWTARLYRSTSSQEYTKISTEVDVRANVEQKCITISIPRTTLRGNPLNWGYVVAVMGNDRENINTIPHPLVVVSSPDTEHVFRGMWAGFAPPPLIDVLVPQGKSQKKMLEVYKKRVPITLQAVRIKP
ncbi:MAG: glucodextranase DOMON-like domain-containing protein [bacterium]